MYPSSYLVERKNFQVETAMERLLRPFNQSVDHPAIEFACRESAEGGPDDRLVVQRKNPETLVVTRTTDKPFKFIDLFAGIGGIRLAMEAVGGECEFSSEIDASCVKTYEANFGDKPHGDITTIAADEVPDHDVLVGGFPCQPFSIIGKQEGFADEKKGTLFFEIERILKAKRPKAFLLENVKQFKSHDEGRTCRIVVEALKVLGYDVHVKVLNALDFGVPQKRERTFIVGFLSENTFEFPVPFKWYPPLEKVLEDEVDPKLTASADILAKRRTAAVEQGKKPTRPTIWHENKGGNLGIHPFSCALRHNASYNYLLVNGERRMSSRELLRMQGFPDDFKIAVPHSVIRAQCGNAVAVPKITAIAARMAIELRRSLT